LDNLVVLSKRSRISWSHDAAVSKLAREEERDARWVRAGAKANLLSLPTVRVRMNSTMFLDDEEHRSAIALVDQVMASQ
jgi:hypothetical protein